MTHRIRAAAAASALLLAGCSSHSAPAGAHATAGSLPHSPSAVDYSRCVRAHGVPTFPDPGSDGKVPKVDGTHLGVGQVQLQAAEQACLALYPTGGDSLDQQAQQCLQGGSCPQGLVQQILAAQRRFATCMRAHGLPKFPDPTLDSQGRPVFVISISGNGFDPHSDLYHSKETTCQRLAPAPEARQVNP